MKYLYRFEEMVETREKIITDTQNVVNEQKALIAFLQTHPEKRFDALIASLEDQVAQASAQLAELNSKNIATKALITHLKDASKKSIALVEELLDEIGIFKQQEEK